MLCPNHTIPHHLAGSQRPTIVRTTLPLSLAQQRTTTLQDPHPHLPIIRSRPAAARWLLLLMMMTMMTLWLIHNLSVLTPLLLVMMMWVRVALTWLRMWPPAAINVTFTLFFPCRCGM
jgi:hypothetical protein